LEKRAPKVARLLEEHGEEILGVYALYPAPTQAGFREYVNVDQMEQKVGVSFRQLLENKSR